MIIALEKEFFPYKESWWAMEALCEPDYRGSNVIFIFYSYVLNRVCAYTDNYFDRNEMLFKNGAILDGDRVVISDFDDVKKHLRTNFHINIIKSSSELK
jgi:hypothetical protein